MTININSKRKFKDHTEKERDLILLFLPLRCRISIAEYVGGRADCIESKVLAVHFRGLLKSQDDLYQRVERYLGYA